MKKLSRSYYFDPVKIVRDLVHEYVNLTRFDLEIIDTVSFQRLKDIRQLTCQHVYPAANHTRFEHSLGVLELTRKAIRKLNKNGLIDRDVAKVNEPIINENLQFNAALAALLHDVGHCLFSHLGEKEFDPMQVKQDLTQAIHEQLDEDTCKDLYALIENGSQPVGSIHEQLSCIIILQNFYDTLVNLNKTPTHEDDTCELEVDFELIMRSILGIEYDISTVDSFKKNKEKNVIIRLINSNIFDMDKLDYIMRDAFFTGIGPPVIDTKRLFRNMYFSKQYTLVFTSKAIPALQNMIDARDGLYMYVYNHHAVIFSDFLNTYIARRLSHNAEDYLFLAYPEISEESFEADLVTFQISALGLVPKPYLFSIESVAILNRSDSDWQSLLNVVHSHHQDSLDWIKTYLKGSIAALPEEGENGPRKKKSKPTEKQIEELAYKVQNAFALVHQYKTRRFLKPWWKTVYEFSNFMNQYFRDDIVRKNVGKYICTGGDSGLDASEFRSQIAKHVIHITQTLGDKKGAPLAEPLSEGDFFVIQRSTRFFAPDTIEKLEICLKSSEIVGPPVDVNYQTQEYYVKTLTNIIPQKDYTSIYAKEGFYVFSAQIGKKDITELQKKNHYKLIEQIFVFVASEFIQRGEQDFVERFQHVSEGWPRQAIKEQAILNENKSMQEMAQLFKKQYIG